MSDESISSPPYPGLATGSRGLYRDLMELRTWLEEEQEQIKYKIKGKFASNLEKPDNMAAECVWEGVGVVDKYVVLHRMRQLREGWDGVLRDHEDTWDCKMALKRRYDLFMLAHYILREAFINPETREFREQKQFKDYMRKSKLIQQKLNELLHLDSVASDDSDDTTESGSDEGAEDEWFSDGTA